MGEIESYSFEFREIAELLVKKLEIHSGIWAISFQLALTAANIASPPSPEPSPIPPTEIRPAIIIPILKIGLQKVKEENNLTVNAAKVNPLLPE